VSDEVALTARIGGNVEGLLASLVSGGAGVKDFAARAGSALAAVGLATFLADSVKVSMQYETANARMKSAVMSTSGTVAQSGNAVAAAEKAHKNLLAAQDALAKLELGQASSSKKSHTQTIQQQEVAALKLKEAHAKVTDAMDAYDKAVTAAAPHQNATIAAWSTEKQKVDDLLSSVSNYSAYSKLQLTDAFTTLTQKTGSADIATRDLKLASDMARGGHMDLGQATTLLAKIEDGRVSAVQRALPFLDKSMSKEQALAAIRKTYGGQAGAYADTTQGKIDKFHNALEELQKTIGDKLLPKLTPILDWLSGAIKGFDKLDPGLQSNILSVAGIGSAIAIALPWVTKILGAIGTLAGGVSAGTVALWTLAAALAGAVGYGIGSALVWLDKFIAKMLGVKSLIDTWGGALQSWFGLGGSGEGTVQLGPAMKGKINPKTGKAFAIGGLATGPDSGYPATLHGRERVIPLGARYAPQARQQLGLAAAELGVSTGNALHMHFPGVGSRQDAYGVADTIRTHAAEQLRSFGAPVMDFGG
jgi:hypothetical protein